MLTRLVQAITRKPKPQAPAYTSDDYLRALAKPRPARTPAETIATYEEKQK